MKGFRVFMFGSFLKPHTGSLIWPYKAKKQLHHGVIDKYRYGGAPRLLPTQMFITELKEHT